MKDEVTRSWAILMLLGGTD